MPWCLLLHLIPSQMTESTHNNLLLGLKVVSSPEDSKKRAGNHISIGLLRIRSELVGDKYDNLCHSLPFFFILSFNLLQALCATCRPTCKTDANNSLVM
jgi:hypothetical protein